MPLASCTAHRILLAAPLLANLAAGTGAAQVARGVVVDETGEAVRMALVVLLDGSGKQRAATLTDALGVFVVRAPREGSYRLRVERIGYRTSEPVPVILRDDAPVERRIVAAALPLELPALTAAARRRCTTRPAEGEAVALLWYEARKALQSSRLGAGVPSHWYRIRRYTRQLELPSLRVVSDSSTEDLDYMSGSPFVSARVESLLERGFIQATDTGTYFFAPDAEVLLSDEFADAYCLTPTDDPVGNLVGIRFQPVGRTGPAAVTGTLWLDRNGFELRRLVYGYTRAVLPEGPVHEIGGVVEFERLPDGIWIVRRWRIRLPVAAERSLRVGANRRARQVLVALSEVGGEVLEVRRDSVAPIPRQ